MRYFTWKLELVSDILWVIVATIMEIMLWDVLMFYQIFLSPQVKRGAVISNKKGVWELPHELPNDLGNKENSGKSQNLVEW